MSVTQGKAGPHVHEAYIASTQSDGRLLLRFVARRTDRTLAGAPEGQASAARSTYGILFEPAATLAEDTARIPALLACIDDLSLRAAPANVRSIRLTATYLGIAMEDGEPPAGIRREARHVKAYMFLVGTLAVALLLAGISLLAHMDTGRRLLQQLKDLRQIEAGVQKDMVTLSADETTPFAIRLRLAPGAAGEPDRARVVWADVAPGAGDTSWHAAPMCARPLFLAAGANHDLVVEFLAAVPEGEGASFQPLRWREPATIKAAEICRRADDVKVRMALQYSGLADWNCRSHRIFGLFTLPYDRVFRWAAGLPPLPPPSSPGALTGCGAPEIRLPPEIGLDSWHSHETAVTITSAVVAGFLLPLLLGSLGGCAYAMRRIDQKLSTWTLEPQDGRHAVVRVGLAAVLGGLVGVVWTGGEPLAVGGMSLSLAAVAFFVGYAVEPVFKLIETVIIDAVILKVTKLGAEPPVVRPPPPVVVPDRGGATTPAAPAETKPG